MSDIRDLTVQIISEIVSRWLRDNESLETFLKQLRTLLFDAPVLLGEPHAVLSYNKSVDRVIQYANERRESHCLFLLSLTAAAIPLNNISFPRGLWIAGVKFPLLSEAHINELVLLSPQQRLKFPKYRIFALKPGVDRRFFKHTLSEIIEKANDESFVFLRDQFSVISHKIWPQFFNSKVPEYISVSIEEVVREILIRTQMKTNSKADLILFDSQQREIWLASYKNLFFGVRDGYRQFKLTVKDNKLIAEDFEIDLDSNSLLSALKENRIAPTYAFSEWFLINVLGVTKFSFSRDLREHLDYDALLMQKRMNL